MNGKTLAAATLALAGALAAGAAQAGEPDVRWSVTIGSPGTVYGPVYPVSPAYPVYAPAYPVYAPAPPPRVVYLPPRVVYTQPAGYGWGYGRPTRWDADGDGIPNRRDRLYNPVWDRDGDGIPNRYDRQNRGERYVWNPHRGGREDRSWSR